MAMIDLPEAYEILLANVRRGDTVELPLADALYRTLASDIQCDLDFPPFDRAVMDGLEEGIAVGPRMAILDDDDSRIGVLPTKLLGRPPEIGLITIQGKPSSVPAQNFMLIAQGEAPTIML